MQVSLLCAGFRLCGLLHIRVARHCFLNAAQGLGSSMWPACYNALHRLFVALQQPTLPKTLLKSGLPSQLAKHTESFWLGHALDELVHGIDLQRLPLSMSNGWHESSNLI